MNATTRLEFELADYDVAVQYVNQYVTAPPTKCSSVSLHIYTSSPTKKAVSHQLRPAKAWTAIDRLSVYGSKT